MEEYNHALQENEEKSAMTMQVAKEESAATMQQQKEVFHQVLHSRNEGLINLQLEHTERQRDFGRHHQLMCEMNSQTHVLEDSLWYLQKTSKQELDQCK